MPTQTNTLFFSHLFSIHTCPETLSVVTCIFICKSAVIASVCLFFSQEVDQSVELFCGPCREPGSYRATVCRLESLQVSFSLYCAVSNSLSEVSTSPYLLSKIPSKRAWLNLSFIWQCKWKSNSKKDASITVQTYRAIGTPYGSQKEGN